VNYTPLHSATKISLQILNLHESTNLVTMQKNTTSGHNQTKKLKNSKI